mmetsp:Transcript_20948/g.45431  ORF Transcript_20948/g.45431 Transcript_20948/m.45431 type:complete len:712 (+) Transcript_20948:84-2219(+)|eukprot:CAMPEP_0172316170 /NCGR_PEP_ID=MMETSP1058-20130122/27490_1 /TAXON_ID=83371 /ORGANISM="Detonula confervacea, Strain CCMP 353" /LENGTH=711 /DNA_ID=CAMNT_0013030427 /DNA_START=44 /DNA_END=2179 /DNA_ORIENTATION=+
MPPFRSQRFDPYGEGAATTAPVNPNASLPNGTARQRTLVGNGRPSDSSGRSAAGGGHATSSAAYRTGSSTRRQPPHSSGNTIHDRILGSHQDGASHRHGGGGSRAFPQGHNSGYSNSYVDRGHRGRDAIVNQSNHGNGNGVVMGKTGASPLARQVHPLMEVRKRPKSQPNAGDYNNPYSGDKSKPGSRIRHQPAPYTTPASNFLSQSRRILSLLLGQIPEDDLLALQKQQQYGLQGSSEEEILLKLLSAKSTVRILRLFLLIPLLIFASKRVFPPLADRVTRPKAWRWSAGVAFPGMKSVASRNLAGRNCVMNYFIEKQPPDEYDPDFVEIKPGEKNKDGTPKIRPPVKIVDGSYRTKGQVHVISRFVEAVADSFRSNTGIRQHIIFTEVRDSGHLAFESQRHWPPRGKHRTTVHVLASGELPHDTAGRNAAKALGYGSLEDIEERFKGTDKALIYDRDGNIAGLPDVGEDMDDDEMLEGMEIDVPDRETLELRMRSGKNRRMKNTNATLLPDGTRPYPNLRALLPFEEEDDGDGEIVVPYLHVDGMSMENQLLVLESARSLLEDSKVVAVGVEHSPDMDVRVLIKFFTDVRYKTFFLGARQVARIDNLCDEVLDDVLDHPSVGLPQGNLFRRFFIRLGLISKEELRISGDKEAPEGPKRRETPPFFVAMPRGRRSKEEMTIQHMYDLFGGYGGGGGQIKTANDRKAPGVK